MKRQTRILILSNFFTEGHGGTPESVLLLAQQLEQTGVICDVLCNRGLCLDVGKRKGLPKTDEDIAFQPQPRLKITDYTSVFVAGSWNRRAPKLVLRAVLSRVPVFYAAKGCLCRIEFTRLRDVRRVPYLLLIEWLLLVASKRILFTSRAEMAAYVLPSVLWKKKAALIPEPFQGSAKITSQTGDVINFGFLAEISPRKGLAELIAGFGLFLRENPHVRVKLKIAGAQRIGAEAYFARCHALADANGSHEHIEWLAPIRGASRDAFYAGLDLFICPSQFESFGLTLLEALWQGTPVCAAPQLGVLEFLVPDAPVLRLASLRERDVAEGFLTFFRQIDRWKNTQEWAGRPACSPSNAQIAEAFTHLFIAEASQS